MDARNATRLIVLGAVTFGSTLLVLAGLAGVLGRPSPAAPTPTGTPLVAAPSPPPPAASDASGPSPSPTAPSVSSSSRPSSPAPEPDPVLVGAGDIADCASDGDEATAALLDGIEGTVFTAGDNAYEAGRPEEFRDCYEPSWGRHLGRTWPAPGNHDWATGDLTGYRDYFGAAAAGPDGASWYARDLGTWRVVVLDSACDAVGGCGPDSPQGRWLSAELAATEASCTVAIFHLPRFSSGDQHGDDPAVDPFWRALYAAGVDVIVSGHEHSYERFAPQDPDGREDRTAGIRQFVVGTGGRELRGFADPRPNSELRAAVAHGVLALTLKDGGYEWRFHAAGSDFADAGTAPCH